MEPICRFEEEPVGCGHRWPILSYVVEHRLVDTIWMNPMRGLPKLVRIAQQYKVVCRASDCEHVCERHLPGLIDDQVIQPRREASASEKPWRTGNDLDLVRG